MTNIVIKKHLFRFGVVCAGLITFFCIQMALFNHQTRVTDRVAQAKDERLRCMLVLEEFRLVDQKLTRYARAYCEAPDEQVRKNYDDIYHWSTGMVPRPSHLDPLISFGAVGATISQIDILAKTGVPGYILAFFQAALDCSNSLAEFEEQAMQTVLTGKIADGPETPVEGENPEQFVRRVLYSKHYQDLATRLNTNIEIFNRIYSRMMASKIKQLQREGATVHRWTFVTQIVTVCLMSVFLGRFFMTFHQEEGIILGELAHSKARLTQAAYNVVLLENELKLAGQIQQEFLPAQFAATEHPAIWGRMLPAKAAGGDFYDYHWIDPDRLAFSIGDVSGKGMTAAMFMARTLTLFRAGICAMGEKSGYDLAYLVTWINRQLNERNDHNMFVTFFVGILDKVKGRFNYCNAGHHYAIIMRPNGQMDVIATVPDLILGIDSSCQFQEHSVPLQVGDTIILYTDGVVEAFSDKGDVYGEQRLHDFLKNKRVYTQEVDKIVNLLIEHVQQFSENARQSDDITVLVLKYQ